MWNMLFCSVNHIVFFLGQHETPGGPVLPTQRMPTQRLCNVRNIMSYTTAHCRRHAQIAGWATLRTSLLLHVAHAWRSFSHSSTAHRGCTCHPVSRHAAEILTTLRFVIRTPHAQTEQHAVLSLLNTHSCFRPKPTPQHYLGYRALPVPSDCILSMYGPRQRAGPYR
jgi:hypothetical protein